MNNVFWLSLIVFLPTVGALVIAFIPKDRVEALRNFSLAITGLTFLASIGVLLLPASATYFDRDVATMQNAYPVSWIPSFDIAYSLGVDGISLPLVLLTTLISLLAMAASWSVTKYVKAYCILFLILETAMLGVFLALDFFLFFVFWEVMLLPMYFLIGVWGGPRREYAAIKFFLYTLLGGVLMLIAILMLYFKSDLRAVAAVSNLNDTNAAPTVVWDELNLPKATTDALKADPTHGGRPWHTFNLLALAAMGQHTDVFDAKWQTWAFLLLFIGFIIKVPSVPLHTWLPDAHVEAPTPISMILAGVLLKMGGYGIIRICYPICPHGGYELMYLVCGIGVVSMVYGGFAALAQTDFKRMVAYSSVSHMGYVVLGLGVWSATWDKMYNSDYWIMGVKGAMFQMVAHGISSAGMFFMVGVIYDRVHHRDLNQFGGLFGRMPVYTALSIGIFFAALGLPGLCGFIGEVFVVLSAWRFNETMAVISASVVILTAAYILWAIQRVYLGPEYRGPHAEALRPANARENTIAGVLFVLAILLGVFPQTFVLRYMDRTVDQQVESLAKWTAANYPAPAAPEAKVAENEVRSIPNSTPLFVSRDDEPSADVQPGATAAKDLRAAASPDQQRRLMNRVERGRIH